MKIKCKKRIMSLLLVLAMLFALTGCGGSASDESADQEDASAEESVAEVEVEVESEIVSVVDVEEENDVSEEVTAEGISFGDLLNVVFVELADGVGDMTFNECVTYMEEAGYEAEITEPSEEDDVTGQVKIYDDNSFHLTIDFFPNDDGDDTICLLSYSDGNFEGSVSDNAHSASVTYGTYDVTAETMHTDVDSVDNIIAFFTDEVPARYAAYQASTAGNGEIEVTFSPSYEIIDGQVIVTVETNLPDGTELMFSLTADDGTKLQSKATVSNGVATSEGFFEKGGSPSGHYTFGITMVMAKLQDESVTDIIGMQGEFLTGAYVEGSDSGNSVSATFEFEF